MTFEINDSLYLFVHVLHAAGESPPVCENEERKVLAVEVEDGLSGLVGGIRIPNLNKLDK